MSAEALAEREELTRLLQAVGAQDERAFTELYKRVSSRLFGVCMKMLRDRAESEEVLQEVFTTVWRRAESFDASRASAITWLVTMSRNKAIDRLRQRRESTLDDDSMVMDLVDEGPSPVNEAQSSEERKRLERCMDGLEPQHKAALREAFFSGVTYNDLAARCRVPLGTMKSWIRRSLTRLRTCLEQ